VKAIYHIIRGMRWMDNENAEQEETIMERVETGIVGLDEMLNGGFCPGGEPGGRRTGTARPRLACSSSTGITNVEPGIILTFEEFPSSTTRRSHLRGFQGETEPTARHHVKP
jgi:hypothetical protein